MKTRVLYSFHVFNGEICLKLSFNYRCMIAVEGVMQEPLHQSGGQSVTHANPGFDLERKNGAVLYARSV